MKRRKFLTGTGAIAAGGAAALGSGAFSRVQAQRDVSIQVAEDPDGYLGLQPTESANGSSYVSVDDSGRLTIHIGENSEGGEGVNADAQMWFDEMFRICNQGTQGACVSWDFAEEFEMREDAELRFYFASEEDDDSDSSLSTEGRAVLEPGETIPIEVGECTTLGMGVDTYGVDASVDEPLFTGSIQFTADLEGDCGLEGSPGTPGTPGDADATSISIADQTTDGTSVSVSATLAEDGYISLHDMSRLGEPTRLGNEGPHNKDVVLGSLIGISDRLAAGIHENVEVDLFTDFAPFESQSDLNDGTQLTRTQPLIAIPHQNTSDTGQRFREDPNNQGEQLGTFEARGRGIGDIAFFEDSVEGADIVKTIEDAPVANDIAVVEVEGDDSDENLSEAEAMKEELINGDLQLPGPDIEEANPVQTSISVDDQTSDGSSVTVSVVLAEDGYISLHDMSRLGQPTRLGNQGPPNKDVVLGSLVAITDRLPAGVHRDVEVELFNEFAPFERQPELNDGTQLVRSQPLVAIPHQNTSDTGQRYREDPDVPGEQLGTFEARGRGIGDIAFFADSVDDAGIEKVVEDAPVANDIAVVELDRPEPASNLQEARAMKQAILEGDLQLPAPET